MSENTGYFRFILRDNIYLKSAKTHMTEHDLIKIPKTIKGLASIALEGAVEIIKLFEAHTGYSVILELLPSAEITVLLSQGRQVDFVFYPSKPIKKFTEEGVLSPEGFTPVVKSGIGIAVPMSSNLLAPKNAQDLKEILLSVDSILYATGPSGDHIENILLDLKIRNEISHKIKIISGLVAKGIENGEGAIGFQQIPEILLVPGAKLLSPLPKDIQLDTPFVLSVHSSSKKIDVCKELFKYLSDSNYRSLYAKYGLQMIEQ